MSVFKEMLLWKFCLASALALLVAGVGLAPGCSAPQRTQLQLKYFLVTADANVQLTVVCEGDVSYRLLLKPGEPVEIGGPEALCVFETGAPVKLEAKAVWRE